MFVRVSVAPTKVPWSKVTAGAVCADGAARTSADNSNNDALVRSILVRELCVCPLTEQDLYELFLGANRPRTVAPLKHNIPEGKAPMIITQHMVQMQ